MAWRKRHRGRRGTGTQARASHVQVATARLSSTLSSLRLSSASKTDEASSPKSGGDRYDRRVDRSGGGSRRSLGLAATPGSQDTLEHFTQWRSGRRPWWPANSQGIRRSPRGATATMGRESL